MLSNLISLCRRHHRAVHEEGYARWLGERLDVGWAPPLTGR
jgi:hypothetical protein